MLHALKYQADLSMLEPLTSLMLSHAPPWIEQVRFDAILAVPMSDTRRLEHGFNQSDEIAQYISNRYNVPLLSRHTVYRYHTAPIFAVTIFICQRSTHHFRSCVARHP